MEALPARPGVDEAAISRPEAGTLAEPETEMSPARAFDHPALIEAPQPSSYDPGFCERIEDYENPDHVRRSRDGLHTRDEPQGRRAPHMILHTRIASTALAVIVPLRNGANSAFAA